MRWIRSFLTILVGVCVAGVIGAQTPTVRVSGTVTDRGTGAPIAAATVIIVGTKIGGQTDDLGRFTLMGVTTGAHDLRVIRLGYAPLVMPLQVVAGTPMNVDAKMQVTTTRLTEMVVVGYGAQRRSDLTGSVSSVKPSIEQLPVVSLEQTLQGAAAGVMVTQASAAPGGGMSIRVRGGSSVTGNNEPLYVIDGMPISNDPDVASPSDGGRDATVTVPSNPLATLNPDDIESIEILKDASATSIYGARGANGVILITTKKGAGGTTRFTLDTYTGTQQVAHPYKLLNAQGFASFANAWSVANGTGTIFTDTASLGKGTDWQSEIFRTAPVRNLQLGVSGGTTGKNPTLYSLSGGVFSQDGVVLGSNFRRTSLRGNVDQTVGANMRITSTLNLVRVASLAVPTDGSFNAGAGAVGAALQYYPTLPVRRADGTYTLIQLDSKSPLAPSSVPNPVSMAADVKDNLTDLRMLASVSGEYRIFEGLKFKVTGGADIANRARYTYYPRTTLLGSQTNGLAIRGSTGISTIVNENTLNYTRTLANDHRLDVLVGYSRQSNETIKDQARNTQFVSDIDGYESIGSGTQFGGPTISSNHSKWTLASYISRLNYSFKERYLLTLSERRDGSSRFGADHQWGEFPSVALAWRVSEEPWMQRFPAIDQLKLRATVGSAGNPSIQPYQSLAKLNAQQYTLNGAVVSGYYPASVPNTSLTWETTHQSNIGTDFDLWNGRLSVTADIYRKKTSNLLLAVNLPMESGFSTALQNVGAVANNGFEISARMQLLQLQDRYSGGFTWSTVLSYAKNKNKVLDLGGVNQIFATSVNSDLKLLGSLIRVGEPLGVFYGYKVDGIFRDSAAVTAYTVKPLAGSTWHPGDARLVDVNGDGLITVDDRTIIGDPNPKFTGGWQNTFEYHGVRLSTSMDYSHGAQLLNLNLVRLEGGSPATNIIADRWYNSWTATNPDAKYPRVNFTPGTIGSDITSDLLEDGSFVRLRTVTLDYAIPTRLYQRSGLTGVRVYVSGSNLATWTKYSGFNPDVSSLGIGNVNRGIDVGAYPLAKSVTFGINLTY